MRATGMLAGLLALFMILAAPGAAAAATSPLKGATVVVDPGHNGANARHLSYIDRLVPAGGFHKECDTTGTATADERLSESAFNWDVARRLTRLLRRAGAKVVLTRRNDRGFGPCIDRRARIGNRARADVAISIHADGGPPAGRGFHVIRPAFLRGYTGPIVRPSLRLARQIRAALDGAGLARADYIGRQGIDRRGDLGGLNLSKVPKVMAELGNMRNAGDARRLKQARWRQRVARALRGGLAEFLARERARR